AAVSLYSSNEVAIYRGLGTGGFQLSNVLKAGGSPYSMAIADLNLDGRDDLAVANQATGDVSVYLNKGGLNFELQARFSVDSGSFESLLTPAAGDVDGDGRIDLAVGRSFTVTILPNLVRIPAADPDGIKDSVDTVTDTDGDGFGNPGFTANTCAL